MRVKLTDRFVKSATPDGASLRSSWTMRSRGCFGRAVARSFGRAVARKIACATKGFLTPSKARAKTTSYFSMRKSRTENRAENRAENRGPPLPTQACPGRPSACSAWSTLWMRPTRGVFWEGVSPKIAHATARPIFRCGKIGPRKSGRIGRAVARKIACVSEETSN